MKPGELRLGSGLCVAGVGGTSSVWGGEDRGDNGSRLPKDDSEGEGCLEGSPSWTEASGVNSENSLTPGGWGRDLYSQSGSPAPGRTAVPSPSASAQGVAAGRDPCRRPKWGGETRCGAGTGRRRGGGCGGSCGPQAGARGPAWVRPEKQQCVGRGLVAMASRRAGPEERRGGDSLEPAALGWWAGGGAWRKLGGAEPREEAGPPKGWGEVGTVLWHQTLGPKADKGENNCLCDGTVHR